MVLTILLNSFTSLLIMAFGVTLAGMISSSSSSSASKTSFTLATPLSSASLKNLLALVTKWEFLALLLMVSKSSAIDSAFILVMLILDEYYLTFLYRVSAAARLQLNTLAHFGCKYSEYKQGSF